MFSILNQSGKEIRNKTLFQNGFYFNILLFAFKLALLASFEIKYSFDISAQERGKKG